MDTKKPPLGAISRHIWEATRINDLRMAMIRYLAAMKDIPDGWQQELEELISKNR